jgi:hypothetical protein
LKISELCRESSRLNILGHVILKHLFFKTSVVENSIARTTIKFEKSKSGIFYFSLANKTGCIFYFFRGKLIH